MAASTGVEAVVRPPREYELTYILRPQTTPSDAEKVAGRVTDVVERFGGRLVRVDNWGKRRLAYPMARHSRGVYVHVRYVAPGDTVTELERNLRILDPVIRFLTVQREEEVDLGELDVDPEEVAFHHLEVTEDEEEENIEQRLGLAPARSSGSDDDFDGDGSDDDDDSGDDGGGGSGGRSASASRDGGGEPTKGGADGGSDDGAKEQEKQS
jgi:small subunit ribosomal protein S6